MYRKIKSTRSPTIQTTTRQTNGLVFSLLVTCLLVTSTAVTAQPKEWDLADLYADVPAWDAARQKLDKQIDALLQCENLMARSASELATCLEKMTAAHKEVWRIYTYSFLAKDTDLSNSAYRERQSIAQTLYSKFEQAVSFVEPALQHIGAPALARMQGEEQRLADYDFLIRNALRKGRHLLSAAEESILAAADNPLLAAADIYDVLNNAEMPRPQVTLADGTTVNLTASVYAKYRAAANRADRKLVFDQFWQSYRDFQQSLATTLEGNTKANIFRARTRHYPSALHAALAEDNIPDTVYHTLISTVNSNLPTLHRYLALRARMLSVADSQYYDIYPAVIDIQTHYGIAESRRIIVAALAPLGTEYVAKLRWALSQNWMHIYPRDNKSSGAYVMGAAYDVHPYVLLNHNDDFESLSTFAHEWGHAMHSLLANESQPFQKADYPTFIAEIASIANEVLLYEYLRENATSDDEKLYFLFKELQGIRGTFFRQTQFAEFELAIHQRVEQGGALSADILNNLYGDLLKRYHGHDRKIMEIDEAYTVEWAYIPHFYRNFYVYQYATSLAAAYHLTEKILAGGDRERSAYLSILRAGGSDYPYDILNRAGMDMATPAVYQAVIRRANRLMDEIEKLLARRQPASP